MNPRWLLPTTLVALGLVFGCSGSSDSTASDTKAPPTPAKTADAKAPDAKAVDAAADGPVTKAGDKPTYANVQKIFTAKCVRCHGAQPAKGLKLTSYEDTVKTDTMKAGDAKSEFMDWLNGTRTPQMPKGGKPLDKVDQDLIQAWIVAGAKNDS